MKKDVALTLPYVAILVINFYLLPFLAKDTGTAMLFMLCIMPLIAVVSSIAYGVHNGFHIVLPVAAVLLFIPTIFIHSIYLPGYMRLFMEWPRLLELVSVPYSTKKDERPKHRSAVGEDRMMRYAAMPVRGHPSQALLAFAYRMTRWISSIRPSTSRCSSSRKV